MSAEESTNNDSYLVFTDSLSLVNDSNITTLNIEFTSIEIYSIVIPFLLAIVVNITLCVSLIQAVNNSQECIRRANKLPVVDLIILILSFTTIFRLFIRSGLQILCILGYCIDGVPLCLFHGFFNSLLQYVYLWTLALLIQDRYIKYRQQHDYTSKCSSLIVLVTIVGVIFVSSIHVCGPIWGFSNYEFMRDELTCAVNWKAEYSCPYLVFSIVLISIPANLPLITWTVLLIYKTIKRRYFNRTDKNKTKDSPVITVTLTSSLASSSIAALSRSLVLNESYETLTVIIVSVIYQTTSAPKHLLDSAMACLSNASTPSLIFWSSICSEVGSTLIIPLVFLTFHPKLRTAIHLGIANRENSHQRDAIYLSTIPSTSMASTSNTAVTVM